MYLGSELNMAGTQAMKPALERHGSYVDPPIGMTESLGSPWS